MNRLFRNIFKVVPDKMYLQMMYFNHFHKLINFNDPKTFNEKLNWLKLYDRNPEYTRMVDKYAVRQYIAEKLGEENLIPLLRVWDDPHEIDFDQLPDQFVLKWNHDSGSVVICKDKSKLNIPETVDMLASKKNVNGFWYGREWPYKAVKPKLVAERYMVDESGYELKDYKFFCFNGKADCVMVCYDRASGDTKFYFFDRAWNLMRYNKRGKEAPANFTIPKASNMDEMFDMAEKLSQGMPFARIDFYSVSGKTYFGEITLYPTSGFDANLLQETELRWGEMITLSNIN